MSLPRTELTTRVRRAAAIVALGAAAATGCVLPDQINQVQRDVADLQQQLGQARRAQRDSADELEAMRRNAETGGESVTREELADLLLRVERITRELATSDQRIQDLHQRLDRFSQDLHQTRELARNASRAGYAAHPNPGLDDPGGDPGDDPGGLSVVRSGSPALPDPEALYNSAYADFSKGNFALAISGFEEYQQRFADSALADNALYWIGECHFSQGDFPAAVQAFDRLLDRYPRSDKAAAADLKKGLAYMEQNQVGQAIVQLRFVVSRYPGSDESRIARDKLAGLGATND